MKCERTIFTSVFKTELGFVYDAKGNRVKKTNYTDAGAWSETEYYVRDAQGNVMAIYKKNVTSGQMNYILTEQHIYGSARLGVDRRGVDVIASSTVTDNVSRSIKRGEKHYELSNHLGNVLATVSDKKIAVMNGANLSYYRADIVSYSDYYPFGAPMTERTASLSDVRYGFNGKEMDSEGMGGGGNTYDYGFRIYNPNLAKFLSVDPLFKTFAMLTPYQFASNTPIAAIDIDGLEAKIAIYGAGVKRDENGKIVEKHEAQFKKEADKDVKQQNATVSLAIHKGDVLVQTLKDYTASEGSIEYLSIASHSGSMGIILDNGQYGKEVVGHPKTANWSGYTSTDIDRISNNADIKFASNALVVFAGCNAGRTVETDGKTPIYSVAKDFTEKSGVASIGAYGQTAPSGKGGDRRADYEYRLFYNDENGVLQQMSLGKELNQEAIDKAKNIVSEVAKKIKEKNAKPADTPQNN